MSSGELFVEVELDDPEGTPIFAILARARDPLADYRPTRLRDVLAQLHTVHRLQERIVNQQNDVNELVAKINASLTELVAREDEEAAKPPLDLTELQAVSDRLEKLNTDQAARLTPPAPEPTPDAPADPAADPAEPAVDLTASSAPADVPVASDFSS